MALAHALLLLDDVRTARRFVNEAASISSQVPDFKPVAQKVADIRADVDVAMSSAAAVIPLTPAELRVLRYLPTHLSFQAIGRDLIVSPNTVKTQAISVYRKLGVSSRAEAVRKAKEQGLLPEGETSHYPSEYRHTAGGARARQPPDRDLARRQPARSYEPVRTLAFCCSNSASVITPRSRRSASLARSSAGEDGPATSRT